MLFTADHQIDIEISGVSIRLCTAAKAPICRVLEESKPPVAIIAPSLLGSYAGIKSYLCKVICTTSTTLSRIGSTKKMRRILI